MPVRGNTFKIFIGNLSDRTTSDDIRQLFEVHGVVMEADVVKNFGFVHMETEDARKAAIEALNGYSLHGKPIVVEASTGAKKSANQRTKIFIGNIAKDGNLQEIIALFEPYGSVVESDILTNYAFVHMNDEAAAHEAIANLDGYELNGSRLRVQESTSRVRQTAGMGSPNTCYRCGSDGHWSKECPRDTRGRGGYGGRGGGGGGGGPDRRDRMGGRPQYGGRSGGGRFDPYPPPPPHPYGRDPPPMRYSRDEYEPFDRYDRYYQSRPLMYERGYERPMPPPQHSAYPEDPYDRRAPTQSQRPDYLHYARRSPPPRYPPPPPPIGNLGYRVPPASGTDRRPLF